jgi:hypothetical protein
MRTTRIRRWSGAVLVAALALVVSAPITSADTGSKQLTKRQWIKAANKICSATDDRIDALDAPPLSVNDVLTPGEFREIAVYFNKAGNYSESGLAALRRLRPPTRDREEVRTILNALASAISSIDRAADAARAENIGTLRGAFGAAGEYADDFGAAAQAYGSTCGAENPEDES